MRRKSLIDLVGKINRVLPEKGRITGLMAYMGREASRTESRESARKFEYKFLGEVARDSAQNYSDNDNGEDWVKRGIGLLEYCFGDNVPKINVTKRGKDEAKIEILYVPRETKKLFKDERKVERLDEVENIKDIAEFAMIIYSSAIRSRRKKGAILEVRGEINETRHPPEFVATLALGIKYDGIKNMEDYKQFSEICESLQDKNREYNKSEEVLSRLTRLEDEIRKSPENPKYLFSKRAIREAPEITLDRGGEVLVIRPFQ